MIVNETTYHKWLQHPTWYRPLPDGAHANLVDPPSLQKYDVLCQTVCLGLTTILVVVRVYTKFRILNTLGWDDVTSVLAWLGLIAFGVVLIECDKYGAGKHQWDVLGKDWLVYNKFINAIEITYTIVILATKVSILLLFLRVFPLSRSAIVIVHCNLWANVVFYIIGFFLEVFECTPRVLIWNPWLDDSAAECINQSVLEIASAILNMLSDFAILVLPIATVWHLNVRRQKKLAILAVFATGLFGCIASLIRVKLTVALSAPDAVDLTWDSYPLELWSYIEISAGIICGCMPALPAFCRNVYECSYKASEAGPWNQAILSIGPRQQLRVESNSKETLETVCDNFKVESRAAGKDTNSQTLP